MWPLAAANLVREGEADPIWSRLHARQGLVLGLLITFAFFVLLAFPLVFVLAIPSISSQATVAVYGVGLVADAGYALAYVLIALRYAARAARGELFSIPVVTAIVDRWLRVERR